MNIRGPLKITIEGPPGAGKTLISNILKSKLDELNILWVEFSEGAEYQDLGQRISIIERQIS